MLTRAKITAIDYNTNVCTVRIPIFETASDNVIWECEAVIAVPPGVYNGYKIDDAVIVGFENHEEGLPVVLGKLYVSADTEKNSNSAMSCSDIKINNSLDIPATATFNFSKADGQQEVSNAAYNVNSLLKLIQLVLDNKNTLTNLKDTLNLNNLLKVLTEDVKSLTAKSYLTAEKDTTTEKITYKWENI